MKKLRTVGTHISDMDYAKLMGIIQKYNEKTNSPLSISEFVWNAIKYYVKHHVKAIILNG